MLRYARSTRGFLILSVVLGVVTAALIIAQARILSDCIVRVTQGAALDAVSESIAALAVIVIVRAVVIWWSEAAAYRTSARAKAQLREEVLAHLLKTGASSQSGELTTVITRGIEALDAYYARYLPQLVLAVIAPVAVLLTVLGQDLTSTIIIAITLPLIPIFMIMIGIYTRSRVDRQWATLSGLSNHFLDLVAGLPTLKVFGRAKSQARIIRELGEKYRGTTMGVLRVSFLSSLALELLASLSVALVAVSIGLRLAQGEVTFSVALFVLLLAPEAYLPIRLVGQHFHAAAEGLGAAEKVFESLDEPVLSSTTRAESPSAAVITFSDVSVTYPGRTQPALAPTSALVERGDIVAVIGPSGGGKSTLLSALLGLVPLTSGSIEVAAEATVAWVPQQAHLVAPMDEPTIVDIVRVSRPTASLDDVRQALADAGVLDDIEALPDGLSTRVGEQLPLSAGQHRRVAVARALLMRADVLVLDEPTAALDATSERAILDTIRRESARGVTVVVVAHRAAIVAAADLVLHIDAAHCLVGVDA